MDKIFRMTKVTKFSDGDENFVQRKFCPTLFCPIRYGFHGELFLDCLHGSTAVYTLCYSCLKNLRVIITWSESIVITAIIAIYWI